MSILRPLTEKQLHKRAETIAAGMRELTEANIHLDRFVAVYGIDQKGALRNAIIHHFQRLKQPGETTL